MRAYLGDPTKIRLIHGGAEMFHVFHLHGGGIRWRSTRSADPTFDYADTGLNKNPDDGSPSDRLDSQSIGPGESYTLEIEGGAGGVQQRVGDLLEHCHIAEHYVAGMWGFWRVYNTLQPDLAPLPDRAAPADRRSDSAGLIGTTMPDGTTLTKDNLDDWIQPLLPPQGVPQRRPGRLGLELDGSTRSDPDTPVYLGEPEDDGATWPNLPDGVPGHPAACRATTFVGNRPKILFNPVNGRPAFPLLRPHIGQRPPFAPNGHSGAPWLGETPTAARRPASAEPVGRRKDGLCPANAPLRTFNVVAIELPIQVTPPRATDPTARSSSSPDKADVLAGRKPARAAGHPREHGRLRRDHARHEITDTSAFGGFSRSNMHIHHVQFDVQGSDGASAGFVYEQSVRPYKLVDPQLTAAAAAGDDDAARSTTSTKFHERRLASPSAMGTESIEIRQIDRSIDTRPRRRSP